MIKILQYKNIILLATLFLIFGAAKANTDQEVQLIESGKEWGKVMFSKPIEFGDDREIDADTREFLKSFKETEDGEAIIHFYVPENDPIALEKDNV